MARQIRPETALAISGIRALQAAKFRAYLDRLPSDSTGIWDYTGERRFVQQRIAELEAGEVVHLQRHQLADELLNVAGLRSRFDGSGPKCFRIEGDALVPEDYERVSTASDGRIVPVSED